MNRRSRLAVRFLAPLALTFAAAAPAHAQEKAARLFERGAFAEEHEGDLATAESLYEAALVLARAEGDARLGTEIGAALKRVRQRTGQEPPERQTSEIIEERIGAILERLENGQFGFNIEFDSSVRGASNELAVFGAAAVPALERALAARPFTVGSRNVTLDTSVAAYLLANLEEPEAVAAVTRAAASPDPLVRLAVLRHADHELHRDALIAGVGDPVQEVRDMAVRILDNSEDPSLAPVFARALADEQEGAVRWFAKYARPELIERATRPDATPWLIERAASRLAQESVEVNRETALLFVNQALRGGDHRAYWKTLRNLFQRAWKDAPAELEQELEDLLLARFDELPFEDVAPLLAVMGGVRSLEAVAREALTRKDRENDLRGMLSDFVQRMPADRFADVLAVYAGLPDGDGSDASYVSHVQAFTFGLARREWTSRRPEDLARTFAALSGPKRTAFSAVLQAYVEGQSGKGRADPVSPALSDAMEALVRMQDDPNAVRSGLRGLGRIDRPDGLPTLLSFCNGGFGSSARDAATEGARDLARSHPREAAALVERAVLEAHVVEPHGRPVGPDALQYLPDEQALAVFESLWARDELSSEQRSGLLQTLVLNIRTPVATQRVLDLWPAIPAGDSVTRTRAIERFGQELFEPAIPILGDALRDANDGVRRIAREAFAAFKEHREALEEYEAWMRATGAQRESIAQLVELLASPDREVLLGAVRALGTIRARTALPQLVRLLERNDQELRAAVHEAIGRMGE